MAYRDDYAIDMGWQYDWMKAYHVGYAMVIDWWASLDAYAIDMYCWGLTCNAYKLDVSLRCWSVSMAMSLTWFNRYHWG